MNSSKNSKPSTYFIYQCGGWAVFTLIKWGILKSLMGEGPHVIFNALFIGCVGFVVSHGLRYIYKKRRIHSQGLKSSFVQCLGFLLLGAFAWEGAIITFHMLVLKLYTIETLSIPLAFFYYYYYFILLAIWSLIYLSVKINQRRRQEEIEKLQMALSLKEAQLDNLKWQMNPHFLFNALNSVRALVSEDAGKAKDMITRMSSLLRYALNSPQRQTIALSEEVRCVESYLALEQVRFEERLRYSIELDPDCRDLEFLPMCIQTLVENAVKHGIAHLAEGGDVNLIIKCEGDLLVIRVENSGILGEDPNGTGLLNTHERLKLVYGEKASFNISQASPNMVAAEIKVQRV